MFGPPKLRHADDYGVVPRLAAALFKTSQMTPTHIHHEFSLQCIEIYQEELFDLLSIRREKLDKTTIRFQTNRLEYKATEEPIMSANDMLAVIAAAGRRRTSASTLSNDHSSRSHMVVVVRLKIMNVETLATCSSEMLVVDLAGSERAHKTGAVGQRLKEASQINSSLLQLGNVIDALTRTRTAVHINYRNSLLTMLLAHALGGNASTVVIVHVAPSERHVKETINSLNFGNRVSSVKNKPVVNEEADLAALHRMVAVATQAADGVARERCILQQEVDDLTEQVVEMLTRLRGYSEMAKRELVMRASALGFDEGDGGAVESAAGHACLQGTPMFADYGGVGGGGSMMVGPSRAIDFHTVTSHHPIAGVVLRASNDVWKWLPRLIIEHIIDYLPGIDALRLAATCTRLRDIEGHSEVKWRDRCRIEYSDDLRLMTQSGQPWRKAGGRLRALRSMAVCSTIGRKPIDPAEQEMRARRARCNPQTEMTEWMLEVERAQAAALATSVETPPDAVSAEAAIASPRMAWGHVSDSDNDRDSEEELYVYSGEAEAEAVDVAGEERKQDSDVEQVDGEGIEKHVTWATVSRRHPTEATLGSNTAREASSNNPATSPRPASAAARSHHNVLAALNTSQETSATRAPVHSPSSAEPELADGGGGGEEGSDEAATGGDGAVAPATSSPTRVKPWTTPVSAPGYLPNSWKWFYAYTRVRITLKARIDEASRRAEARRATGDPRAPGRLRLLEPRQHAISNADIPPVPAPLRRIERSVPQTVQ